MDLLGDFLAPKLDPKLAKRRKDEEALRACARNNHVQGVEALLAEGVDINARDTDSLTALHFATGSGHLKIVRVLVEHFADISATCKGGYSPLHSACFAGKTDVVALLIEFHSVIDLTDDKGNAALHHASAEGYLEIVKLLVEAGSDLSLKNHSGLNAAAVAKTDEIKQYLISKKLVQDAKMAAKKAEDDKIAREKMEIDIQNLLLAERNRQAKMKQEALENAQAEQVQRNNVLKIAFMEAERVSDIERNSVKSEEIKKANDKLESLDNQRFHDASVNLRKVEEVRIKAILDEEKLADEVKKASTANHGDDENDKEISNSKSKETEQPVLTTEAVFPTSSNWIDMPPATTSNPEKEEADKARRWKKFVSLESKRTSEIRAPIILKGKSENGATPRCSPVGTPKGSPVDNSILSSASSFADVSPSDKKAAAVLLDKARDVLFDGFLDKKSPVLEFLNIYQTRFFQLYFDRLEYYSEDKNKLKGKINLRDVTRISLVDDTDFNVECVSRVYRLRAETVASRKEWIESLKINGWPVSI